MMVNRMIKSLKQTEEALEVEKSYLEQLFESAQEAIVMSDNDSRVLRVNSEFTRLFGYTRDEALGQLIDELIAPKNLLDEAMSVSKQLAKGERTAFETVRRRKDGTLITVSCFASPIIIGNDQVGIYGIYRDITEHKQADEALRESEEKFRNIGASAQDAIIMMDNDGNISYLNEAAEKMFGYTKEETIGRELHLFLAPKKYHDAYKKGFARFKKTGKGAAVGKTLELSAIRKDGMEFPIEISVSSVNVKGKWNAIGIVRDVTERKRAENLQREKHAVQRLAEEREIVAKIGRIIGSTLEIEKVYELFAEEVNKVIPFDRIAILIIYPERGTYGTAYITGKDIPGHRPGDVAHLAGSLTEEVVRKRSGQLIQTEDRDEVAGRVPGLLAEFQVGLRSCMAVPLISKDRVIGVLHLQSVKPKAYVEADVNLAESIGAQIAGAIANAQLYAERSRAEEALKESEKKFRLTFENAKDAILWADSETGLIISCNKAAEILLEKKREEIVGSHQTTIHPPDKAEYFANMFKRHMEQKGIADDEAEVITKSGKIIPVHIAASVTLVGGKRIIQGIFRDITERKRAEGALRESEERFRLALEATRDGLWENSFSHKKDFFSDRMFTMLGYEPMDPVNGFDFFSGLVHPDDVKKLLKNYNAINKPGHDDYSVELRFKASDGTWRHILSRGKCVERDEKGKPVRTVGTHTDITDLKQAQEELQRQNDYLDALQETSLGMINRLDLNELLEAIIERAASLIGAPNGYIYLIEPGEAELELKVGVGTHRDLIGRRQKFGEGVTGRVFQTGQPLVVDDYRSWPGRIEDARFDVLRSVVGIPLKSGEQVMGVIGLDDTEEGKFGDEEVKVLSRFADLASIALDNAMLYTNVQRELAERKRAEGALKVEKRAVQRLAEEREIVAKIGQIIGSTLEIEEVYEYFAEEVRKIIPFDRIAINLIHPEMDAYASAYIAGMDVAGHRPGNIVPLAGSLTEEVVRIKSSLLIQTEDKDEVVSRFPRLLPNFQAGLRSLITVPLISKDQAIGVMHIQSVKSKAYTAADVELAGSIGNQIAGAIANAQLYEDTKRTEKALRASEERFALAVQGTNEGIWDWDIVNNSLYWAPRLKELLGYADDELDPNLENFLEGVLHPDDRERVRAALEVHLKDREPYYVEQRQLTKSGEYRWFMVRGQALWDEAGNPIRMVGSTTDITDRKRAEEALRASEERYALAVRGSNDGLWDWDIQNNTLYWSPRLKELLGYADDEIEVSFDTFESILHPEYGKQTEAAIEAHLKDRVPYNVEHRLRTKSGSYRWFYTRGEAVWDDEGQPIRMVGSTTDITERKRAEEEIEKANRRLIKEMREREEFLRIVSHDLGAPVRNISGMAASIIRKYGGKVSEDVRDRLMRIQRNAEHELDLIQDLLELSRIKTRRGRFEEVDLGELVRGVVDGLSHQLEEKGIRLEIADPLPAVICERKRMMQVFQNLIDNACKYMDSNKNPRIEVGFEELEGSYRFSVSDNGIGIKEEDQERIFYVFNRLKNPTTSQVEGKGVGLSAVKAIVEAYGGEVWVESPSKCLRKGKGAKGSTFYFTLAKEALGRNGRDEGRSEHSVGG